MYSRLLSVFALSTVLLPACLAPVVEGGEGGALGTEGVFDPEIPRDLPYSEYSDPEPPPPPPPPGPSCDAAVFDCGVTVQNVPFQLINATLWIDPASKTFDLGERFQIGPQTLVGEESAIGWRVKPAKVVPQGGVLVDPGAVDVLRIPAALPTDQFYKLEIPKDNRRVEITFERACKGACLFDAFVLDQNGLLLFQFGPQAPQSRTTVTVMWDGLAQEFFLRSWNFPAVLSVP